MCDVIMELGASGRNSWRCIIVSELARKTGPQVSEISLFAVLWFRIDQRLLISTVVHISIPGMSSSGYFSCVHWLWLYKTIQWERREHASFADDEWSGHLDAFTRLSEMELLQDYIYCMLKSAHARCITGTTQEWMMPISRHFYPKCKKGPKMSQHVKKFVLASLPPCQAVMNKTPASQSWLLYENMPICTTSHAGNQLSMDGNFSHCDQMPQEVLCEDDGSPIDENGIDDEQITPSKDGSG